MNVIVHALRNNLPWEEKLRLFEEHGDKPWIVSQLRKQGPTWQSRSTLKRELQLLRWKKGLPKVAIAPSEVQLEIVAPSPQEDQLYPQEITKAIAIRARAINAREKAGRLLTQFYDQQTPEERAALHKEQKDQHQIVAEQTRLIQHFDQTGKVLKEGDLTDREELEKEWDKLRRQMSAYRKNVEKAQTEATRLKAQQRLEEKTRRYEELRSILGKQKRNRRKKA